MAKRNNLEVFHDILLAIQSGKRRRTQIMQSANLSHPMLESYLTELITRGLITEEGEKSSRRYDLTKRGYEFIRKYKTIIEFLDTF